MKFARIFNGTTEIVPAKDALNEINKLMMLRSLPRNIIDISAGRGDAHIRYRNGDTLTVRPATEQEITDAQPATETETSSPEWRTLKGITTPFRLYGELSQGAGQLYFNGHPARATLGTDYVTIVRTEFENYRRMGWTADGTKIRLNSGATRFWVAV